jgi:hypothetical protein
MDYLTPLPDEIHGIIRFYMDGYTSFLISRLSQRLRDLYLTNTHPRALRLRPFSTTWDHGLRRLVSPSVRLDGLGFHGSMTSMLRRGDVSISSVTWLSLTKPTAGMIDWIHDAGRGLTSLERLEVRKAGGKEHLIDRLVSMYYDVDMNLWFTPLMHLKSLRLVESPHLSLDWLEGRQTCIQDLALDGRVYSPMQTMRETLRACPWLRSLELLECNTVTLVALGCCIESGLCDNVRVLTLQATKSNTSTLFLMQCLVRHPPRSLRRIYLRGLRWCENWPAHLPEIIGAVKLKRKRTGAQHRV